MKNLCLYMAFAFCGLLFLSSGGCAKITPIKEFIVMITKSTGEIIEEKARTLRDALDQGWRRVFVQIEVGEVKDGDEPGKITILDSTKLKGRFCGVVTLNVTCSDQSIKISVVLDCPNVIRKSKDDIWVVSPDEYPSSLSTIE